MRADIEMSLGRAVVVHEGDLRVTEAGSTVEGLDIRGDLIIDAPGVTIDHCLVAGQIEGTELAGGVLAISSSYLCYALPPGRANIDLNQWPALLLHGMRLSASEPECGR